MAKGFSATLNLKPLPKAEYKLMQAMVAHYDLDGPGELFTILLRLGYDIMHQHDGHGQLWLADIIGTYRTEGNVDHMYTLPDRITRG